MKERIAVIGGGYAGFAAAVTLAAAGRSVTVFEAARTLGGRARRVEAYGTTMDNGAHILLGAYRQTLALLRIVHGAGAEDDLLDRRRLALEQPGVFRLRTMALPSPWHIAAALFTMRGVPRAERLAAIAFVRGLGRRRFRCPQDMTVAALLSESPPRVTALLWEPLCLAALNTPIETASAQVFLNVLRLTFAKHARDSDLLFPRVDLSTLFPDAAAAYVADRGGDIRRGCAVRRVVALSDGIAITSGYLEETFANAVIAAGPHQAKRLVQEADPQTHAALDTVSFEPIVTVYLKYPLALPFDRPMYKLDGWPGQWVFDRGVLDGPHGLAAVVISTSVPGARVSHEALAQAIDAQLRRHWPDLSAPEWSQVIAERRATYACVAGLKRPAPGMIARGLYLAGDYTDPELPATLEAATRSGVAAAQALLGHR